MKTRTLKAIRPADRRHKAEVWPEFVRQHTRLRKCVAAWAQVDLNRAVFRNPLGPFGRLRAGTGLRIIAAHDRRHVRSRLPGALRPPDAPRRHGRCTTQPQDGARPLASTRRLAAS